MLQIVPILLEFALVFVTLCPLSKHVYRHLIILVA